MLIWHCDKLIQSMGTLDIGLIWDEENVETLHIEPRIEVCVMCAKFIDS